MTHDRHYIGDSVYLYNEEERVRLTTENGLGPSNEIYLDLEVIGNLLRAFGRRFDKETLCEIIRSG
jgi:hypothetical protein